MQVRPRPTGVTLLAILSTIGGIFSLVFGGFLLVAGTLLASVLFVASGVIDFFLAIGYLDGSEWAWILGIVFGIINIGGLSLEIMLGFGNGILGIIFSAVTIFYLTRPRVRGFFGRGPLSPIIPGRQLDQTVLPMTTNSPPKASAMARQCQKCGDMIPPGAGFCRACGTVQ